MAEGRLASAPGQLALVQSFLNTMDLRSARDDLAAHDAMQKWLTGRRLISPGTEFDEADRRRMVEVRAALRDLVLANGGRGPQRRAVTTLNAAARRIRLGVRLHPDEGYRLMAEGVGIDRPIGDLLIGVTGAMAAGTWPRLKICGSDICQRAFYDASRNRSGRWCSMAVCGNRAKGRAFRMRRNNVSGAVQDGVSMEAAS